MKNRGMKLFCGLITIMICIIGMTSFQSNAEETQSNTTEGLKISIISDTHFYTTALGMTGSAFESYLASDSKLLIESEPILDAALKKIIESDSNVVLVTGDLTKDGERINHEMFAQKLKILEAAGKKVYVINGNHDISNAKAYQYIGDSTSRVDTTSTDAFRVIYKDYGYDEAIAKDSNTLSYVVEPVPGYRIIAIDSAIYNDDTYAPTSQTAGQITDTTMKWIKTQIKEAKDQGKEIVAMMHHGLVPHFSSQAQFYPSFLIKNYETRANELADAGLSVVFTGHFHAQDISSITSPTGNKIYDIETGSLVTYPIPIRQVALNNHQLTIKTDRVESVANVDLKGAKDFQTYAYEFIKSGITNQIQKKIATVLNLQGVDYNTAYESVGAIFKTALPATLAAQEPNETFGSLISKCAANQYAGDETLTPLTIEVSNVLLNSTIPVYQLIGSLTASFASDSGGDILNPIGDNNISITLNPVLLIATPTVPITQSPSLSSDPVVLFKNVKVTSSKSTIYYGGNAGKTTAVKISAPSGTKYTVTYKSSKTSVAMVSSKGTVTAKKKGTAVISTTIKINGVSKTYKKNITVKKAYIKVVKSKSKMKLKSKYTFIIKKYGYSGTTTWTTSKKKILEINKKSGKATAYSKGTDYVVVKVGKVSKKIKVKVY